MNYKSTRDTKNTFFTSAEVIKKGLADDGGLFVPERIPTLSANDIEKLSKLDYIHRAADILSRFLSDYTYDEILSDCEKAYCEKPLKQ